MQDQPMMGGAEHGFRDAGDEAIFDRANGGTRGQAGAVAEAENVGIHRHGGLAENFIEHHVGGFSTNAGQGFEGFAVCGNDAVMALHQELGEGGDVFGLGLPQADGANVMADPRGTQGGHGLRGWGLGEQSGCNFVHGGIRGLGREHDGDQE